MIETLYTIAGFLTIAVTFYFADRLLRAAQAGDRSYDGSYDGMIVAPGDGFGH